MAHGSEVCCILGVCCVPGSTEQKNALVIMIRQAHPTMTEAKATAAASRVLKEHGSFRTIPKILREFSA